MRGFEYAFCSYFVFFFFAASSSLLFGSCANSVFAYPCGVTLVAFLPLLWFGFLANDITALVLFTQIVLCPKELNQLISD